MSVSAAARLKKHSIKLPSAMQKKDWHSPYSRTRVSSLLNLHTCLTLGGLFGSFNGLKPSCAQDYKKSKFYFRIKKNNKNIRKQNLLCSFSLFCCYGCFSFKNILKTWQNLPNTPQNLPKARSKTWPRMLQKK